VSVRRRRRDGRGGAARAAAVLAAIAAGVAIGTATPAPATEDDARLRHDYLLSCGGCHELDGSGSARVPSLRGLDRLLARPGGRDYVLRVPGVASAPLSDARLAALLDWIFVHFDNHVDARFTAAEVARARAEPLVDPKAARAALE
jgi:mono/diheme cytochrome c family protein